MSDYTNESKAAVVVDNNNNANDDMKEHQKNLNQLQHQLLSMSKRCL